jgi:NO-binding membrane sensor protein with MHYT domain
LVSALIMGVAISGIHYTGMAATYLKASDPTLTKIMHSSDTIFLALSVGITASFC